MLICTISAFHLKLPSNVSHRLSFWKKFVNREFWDESGSKAGQWITALLMPELAVFWASKDYYDALKDYNFMKDKCDGWELKHSFFASMGGFVLDSHGEMLSGKMLYEANACLDKAVCRKLKYEISDKSKADVLSKSVAIVQITRFLLETLARAANALPISPLEYFTCAQVFCALLMYIFWFDKPHGVQEKIRLEMLNQNQDTETNRRVSKSNTKREFKY